MPSNQGIGNIAIMGGGVYSPKKNAPKQYKDRQFQYYDPESAKYTEEYAKYTIDYYKAQVQGLNPDDFFEWSTHYLRLSDLVNASATLTKQIDDYKMVLFKSPRISYVPRGTKIVAAGSTWLVTNPQNVSGTGAGTIVERCNAVWNHLDYYGNIVSEPLVVDRGLAKANSNDRQEFVLITEGYFSIKAQYNPDTAQLAQNSRIMLGSKAYAITGYTDFIQEFTGDYDSVHIVEFNAYYEEPNAEIDDIENHVAGGLTFKWEITVSGDPVVNVGSTTQLTATSERCGETVTSTADNPISYIWESSDENIATVDEAGNVTGVAEGTCLITCTLAQNEAYSAAYELTAEPAEAEPKVAFVSTIPDSVNAFDTVTLAAAYFVDGEATSEVVEWTLSGTDENMYSATIDGNAITISAWGGAVEPLAVTASYGGKSATATIYLRGI